MTTQYSYCIGVAFTATGTGAVSAGTTVTGTSTLFTTEFIAGDYITLGGQTRIVASTPVSNTSLTVTIAFGVTVSGQTITRVRLTNVESITVSSGPSIRAPNGNFQPYSQPLKLGNGLVRGGGWPTDVWRWGYMTQQQRDALRAYSTGASNSVYIKTRTVDSADSYAVFSASMIWPIKEERVATRRDTFELQFQKLVSWP